MYTMCIIVNVFYIIYLCTLSYKCKLHGVSVRQVKVGIYYRTKRERVFFIEIKNIDF